MYNTQKEKKFIPIHKQDLYIDNVLDSLLYEIDNADIVLWNKLYRREVFEGITFPEGKIYEDIGRLYLLVEKAGRLATSTKCIYNYHLQPQSITRTKNVSVNVFEHLYVVIERYEYLSNKYKSEKLEQICRQQIFTTLSNVVDKLDRININNDKRFYDEYNKAIKMVYENYSYDDCLFVDAKKKTFESLKKGIEHYKISRDLFKSVDIFVH